MLESLLGLAVSLSCRVFVSASIQDSLQLSHCFLRLETSGAHARWLKQGEQHSCASAGMHKINAGSLKEKQAPECRRPI